MEFVWLASSDKYFKIGQFVETNTSVVSNFSILVYSSSLGIWRLEWNQVLLLFRGLIQTPPAFSLEFFQCNFGMFAQAKPTHILQMVHDGSNIQILMWKYVVILSLWDFIGAEPYLSWLCDFSMFLFGKF